MRLNRLYLRSKRCGHCDPMRGKGGSASALRGDCGGVGQIGSFI